MDGLDRARQLEVGQDGLNILMLSIVYHGIAFPIVWQILPKAGNSNTDERISIIETFIDPFGTQNIQCLLGDRGFIGNRWF